MALPLMPKATAVWLVENTSLTFEQIADFCGMHMLEIQAIADGDVASHIMGLSPIANNQLSAEEIKRCEEKMLALEEQNLTRKTRKFIQMLGLIFLALIILLMFSILSDLLK